MPDITITLTTAQVDRVKTALNVTTEPEVSAILREYLRGRVLDEELALERAGTIIDANNTIDNEGW